MTERIKERHIIGYACDVTRTPCCRPIYEDSEESEELDRLIDAAMARKPEGARAGDAE